MDSKSSTSSRSPGDVEGEPVAKKTRLVYKTIIYDESIANQWLDEPPLEVWDHHIIPLLSLRDLALARPVCTFFEAYWQDKFSNNVLPLRVGNDVATINDVMGVIEILSSRREYTKLNPFVVLLGKGDHQITSSWTNPRGTAYATMLEITRNNVSFVGTGKTTTRILGGFGIDNLENIMFEKMTMTPSPAADQYENMSCIYTISAKVELTDVAIINSVNSALDIKGKSTIVATRCEFSKSGGNGVYIGRTSKANLTDCLIQDSTRDGLYANNSVVHLYGEATAIHSNGFNGIRAINSSKVVIHLPSHHNTFYNNGGEDRRAWQGGTITNVED